MVLRIRLEGRSSSDCLLMDRAVDCEPRCFSDAEERLRFASDDLLSLDTPDMRCCDAALLCDVLRLLGPLRRRSDDFGRLAVSDDRLPDCILLDVRRVVEASKLLGPLTLRCRRPEALLSRVR